MRPGYWMLRTGQVGLVASLMWTATVFAQGSAATDGFVPVKPGELVEHLPATPLVFAAYAIVWIVVTVYVLTLWRRITKAEREIADITAKLEQQAR